MTYTHFFSAQVLMCLLTSWSIFLLPSIEEQGVSDWISNFKDSEHPYLSLYFIFLVELWSGLCIAKLLADYLKLKITWRDLQKILSDQLTQNILLQFFLIISNRQGFSLTEILICSHNFIFSSLLRASSYFLVMRSRFNTEITISHSHKVIAVLTMLNIYLISSWFYERGVLFILGLNFESIYIMKNCFLNKELSLEVDLKINILEKAVQVTQWVLLAFKFTYVIPTDILVIFLYLSLQKYLVDLRYVLKKYRYYCSSVAQFLNLYPKLTLKEIESLDEKNCCICLEPLVGECNLLDCKHVFHLVCICKWMSFSIEKKCPLCCQEYLNNNVKDLFVNVVDAVNDNQEVRRIQAIFPHLLEEDIRRQLEETGNADLAIENLLGN